MDILLISNIYILVSACTWAGILDQERQRSTIVLPEINFGCEWDLAALITSFETSSVF